MRQRTVLGACTSLECSFHHASNGLCCLTCISHLHYVRRAPGPLQVSRRASTSNITLSALPGSTTTPAADQQPAQPGTLKQKLAKRCSLPLSRSVPPRNQAHPQALSAAAASAAAAPTAAPAAAAAVTPSKVQRCGHPQHAQQAQHAQHAQHRYHQQTGPVDSPQPQCSFPQAQHAQHTRHVSRQQAANIPKLQHGGGHQVQPAQCTFQQVSGNNQPPASDMSVPPYGIVDAGGARQHHGLNGGQTSQQMHQVHSGKLPTGVAHHHHSQSKCKTWRDC